MHHVEPEVYLISKPQIIEDGARNWLNSLGASRYALNPEVSEAENDIMMAAKRCYLSFEPGLNPNVKKIRADAAEYLENILKVGHGSVLEHAYFGFAVEGVSRVFTGEMNRHRAGMAISEGSMRFIRYTDIPYWVPNSILNDESDTEEIKKKKERTRRLFDEVFAKVEEVYTVLVNEVWDIDNLPDFKTKKHLTSALRRIIPMGVATGGRWTGNVRALRHIFTMRCAEGAEEEICLVATKMLKVMIEECPLLFGDFHVNEKGFWGPKHVKV